MKEGFELVRMRIGPATVARDGVAIGRVASITEREDFELRTGLGQRVGLGCQVALLCQVVISHEWLNVEAVGAGLLVGETEFSFCPRPPARMHGAGDPNRYA